MKTSNKSPKFAHKKRGLGPEKSAGPLGNRFECPLLRMRAYIHCNTRMTASAANRSFVVPPGGSRCNLIQGMTGLY